MVLSMRPGGMSRSGTGMACSALARHTRAAIDGPRMGRRALRRSLLFFQRKDFHLAEFDGMTLGLEGNVAFVDHPVTILDQLLRVGVALVELRLLVLQHDFPVD